MLMDSVSQEFGWSTPGMACLCSTMSGSLLGRLDQLGTGTVVRVPTMACPCGLDFQALDRQSDYLQDSAELQVPVF